MSDSKDQKPNPDKSPKPKEPPAAPLKPAGVSKFGEEGKGNVFRTPWFPLEE